MDTGENITFLVGGQRGVWGKEGVSETIPPSKKLKKYPDSFYI